MKPRVFCAGPVILATALTGGFFAYAPAARACSLSGCFGEYIAPAQGMRLPGNAPALFQGARLRMGTMAASPVLTNASGDIVPIVLSELADGRLVKLESPLPAGMYTLTYETTCTGTAKSVPTQFEVVEGAPLPAEVGTVQVGAPTRQTITVAEGGACRADVLADVIALSIVYAPEFVPFLPVATHTLLIDGEQWISTPYGSNEVNIPGAIIRQVSTVYRRPDIGPPYGASWASGIGPGHHQAELIVTVAGVAAPLPSVLFEFEFPEVAAPDGGVGQPAADAGTPSGSVDQPPGGGGCSFVSVSRPASGLVLLGVVGLFALALQGKNKRRRP
jgi:hypothetical protein